MSVTVADLGKRVIAETGLGGKQGEGVMVAFADFPTATINLDSGEQISWAAHLCRTSLGADHVQPVDRDDKLSPTVEEVSRAVNRILARKAERDAQPDPAPREISQKECKTFLRNVPATEEMDWNAYTIEIARYAIRQIESRALQTAPRDPYKRGHLLP